MTDQDQAKEADASIDSSDQNKTVSSTETTDVHASDSQLEEKIEQTEEKLEEAKDNPYASKDDISRLETLLNSFREEIKQSKQEKPKVPAPEKKTESKTEEEPKKESVKEETKVDKPYGSSRWFRRG